MVKLDDYVYRNLKEYGNCVIGKRCIKKYGKQPILDHLKEKGFDARLIVSDRKDISKMKELNRPTYILELKE